MAYSRTFLTIACCVLTSGCNPNGGQPLTSKAAGATGAPPATTEIRYVSPDTHFESEAYSQVAAVSNANQTYYISGQVPIDAEYNVLALDDLRGQAQAVLKNLDMALTEVGLTKEDVVKINVAIVNETPRDTFIVTEELMAYFEREDMPASTVVGASFLIVNGVRVQIDAVAVK